MDQTLNGRVADCKRMPEKLWGRYESATSPRSIPKTSRNQYYLSLRSKWVRGVQDQTVVIIDFVRPGSGRNVRISSLGVVKSDLMPVRSTETDG